MKKIKKVLMSFGMAIIGFVNKVNALTSANEAAKPYSYYGNAVDTTNTLYGPLRPWAPEAGFWLGCLIAIISFFIGVKTILKKNMSKKKKAVFFIFLFVIVILVIMLLYWIKERITYKIMWGN